MKCQWCEVNEVPRDRRHFCSDYCYHEKNRKRARQFQSGFRMSKGDNLVEVTCLGPICRGEKTFMSISHRYNRICPACTNRINTVTEINGENI